MIQCAYCGEVEATEIILNPNWDSDDVPSWDVCKTCKEVIKWQQQLSFGAVLADRPFGKDMGERLMKEAQDGLV